MSKCNNQLSAAAEFLSQDVDIRAVSVLHLDHDYESSALPGGGIQAGSLLSANVSESVFAAAVAGRGLKVKVGQSVRNDHTLLSLLIRAGDHVAVLLADCADDDVRQFISRSLAERSLTLVLSSNGRDALSITPLPESTLTPLAHAMDSAPTTLEEFMLGAQQQILLLQRDDFLRLHGIDASRVQSRTLLLHVSQRHHGAGSNGNDSSEANPQSLH